MVSEVDGFLDLSAGNETGDDLVDHFHIDTVQEHDGTLIHVHNTANERWERQRKPLGVGGFGTAWLETSSSGRVRVVKEVQKMIPQISTKYWIRELSAMALLSKVCPHPTHNMGVRLRNLLTYKIRTEPAFHISMAGFKTQLTYISRWSTFS